MTVRVCALAFCLLLSNPGLVHSPEQEMVSPPIIAEVPGIQLNTLVREFLEERNSPLASDADFLVTLEHWQLVIAISAIESQYCITNPTKHNCWGIMKGKALRRFNSYREGAQYTNDLIAYWRSRGKWTTVEEFNCHYVVPCNETWVAVVKNNLNILNELSK